MQVRRWMNHVVHSVKPHDSIQHARELLEEHRVNQLPVVVDRRLVGIITDRDLRDASPSALEAPLFGSRKAKVTKADPVAAVVEIVMTPNVTTIGPDASMAEAARLMRRQRIGALPVVEHERVVGIITRSNVLDAFVDLVDLEDSREASVVADKTAPEPRASRPRKPASGARRRRSE